jgi:hypothetical protein
VNETARVCCKYQNVSSGSLGLRFSPHSYLRVDTSLSIRAARSNTSVESWLEFPAQQQILNEDNKVSLRHKIHNDNLSLCTMDRLCEIFFNNPHANAYLWLRNHNAGGNSLVGDAWECASFVALLSCRLAGDMLIGHPPVLFLYDDSSPSPISRGRRHPQRLHGRILAQLHEKCAAWLCYNNRAKRHIKTQTMQCRIIIIS